MSKLQRIIVILAAFGIVSILLSQMDSSFSSVTLAANPHMQKGSAPSDQQQAVTTIHINSPNVNNNEPAHATPTIVTNIYQAGSGSFYFESPKQQASAPEYETAILKSTSANINITGPIARTRLTQVFDNPSEFVKSGIYVFPLPQDAAVDHLLMQVGDRKIEGEIKPKEIAHKMYTKAKANGKKASLVSQLRPNMFTNQIANIPPYSQISVTIEYQQFIVQDKYNYSLRLPLSITPRYSPTNSAFDKTQNYAQGTASNETASSNNLVSHLPMQTDISIRLNTGLPVNNISSEHHPISVINPYSTEYKIDLDTTKPINKDFVLHWELQPSIQVQASHFTYITKQHEYGLITLLPPSADRLNAKRNLVFVLDVSGSMVGDAIAQAKQSLAIAIEDLQSDDYFNLVAFSSNAVKMWPQSQLATTLAKQEALNFIYELEANGGTEIKMALDTAFSIPSIQHNLNHQAPLAEQNKTSSDYLNQIIFITDGSVSNENEVMQSIYQKIGDYRLFTVGIGSAPNAYFMTEAATAGKGTFTFIGDIAMVKPKMHALLDKLKRPALTNIKLNIKDTQKAFGFEIYPSILPDLYSGEPLVISYRRQINNIENTNTEQQTEQATTQGNTLPFSVSGTFLSKSVNGNLHERKWSKQLPSKKTQREHGIHKYWARLKIKDLHQQLNMRGPFNQHLNTSHKEMQNSIKKGITNVALQHNLVSKYTSLVAIDHSYDQQANTSNKSILTQSQMNQAKFAMATLPKTATPSALMFLLGSMCLILGACRYVCLFRR